MEAERPSCHPKTPKTTLLPDSSSSSNDSDSDDIARKKRVRNYKPPSAPSHRPPPFAPPPPAGITDNIKTLSLGTDAVIESGGGLVLHPKGNGQWSGVVRDALLEGDWVAVL
ncbi:hypothetical protein WISP_00153 [Willisornis vidua]|uniref:Uncharacterized protein n=1 Tax=Willisornis vidua TaxID=1566151 RepID=A0ABQ9CJK3_9PASS|nr:hypothetical protein WISP_00153 [Willisornis vidua]